MKIITCHNSRSENAGFIVPKTVSWLKRTLIFEIKFCGNIPALRLAAFLYRQSFLETTVIKTTTFLLTIGLLTVSCNPMDKKTYWDNGNLKKEGQVYNGKATGLWMFYYESGEKQSETHYRDEVRHGHTIHYWQNGRKKGEGDYVDGQLHGKWTAFHENGQIEREGDMKNGKENGIWKVWNKHGQQTIEAEYKYGELIYEKYLQIDSTLTEKY